MNSKGHLFINLGKSAIRVIGGIVTLVNDSIIPLGIRYIHLKATDDTCWFVDTDGYLYKERISI